MLIDTYTLMVNGAAMAGSPDKSLVEKAASLLNERHCDLPREIVKGQTSDRVRALNWYTRTSFTKEVEGLSGNSFSFKIRYDYEGDK
jgi:hypothetical protein